MDHEHFLIPDGEQVIAYSGGTPQPDILLDAVVDMKSAFILVYKSIGGDPNDAPHHRRHLPAACLHRG
jgi:hypothetical protein